MLTNSETTTQQYAVKVNGKIIARFSQRSLAESTLITLTPEAKMQAEIVIVDSTGREMLFG
jgi:sulfur carrier protein ThiS